jgi:vacuolar iron transporter family protein
MANNYKDSIQTEIDASFLYHKIGLAEEDVHIKKVFADLSEIEMSHAKHMFDQLKAEGKINEMPAPSGRAKVLNAIGKRLGYDYVIGVLMDTEKALAVHDIQQRKNRSLSLSGNEANHVRILESLIQSKGKVSGQNISRIEGRHKTIGGNALRAAVLGANDGLVSNLSLVMGVAGASEGQSGVLLAGMAGLLAGALSMALGEWISVKSSQELYEKQMNLEWDELEANPEGEKKEIALIYIAKGIPESQALQMAEDIMKDKNLAHQFLVKEELGIIKEELEGSAWEAAITSFFLFAAGAILPVLPFFWLHGLSAIVWSVVLSFAGLFIIGSSITLFTGRSIWFSGMRQVLFGLAAGAITFGIGKLIGMNING